MATMGVAKITRNYQVTFPRDVREMLGIEIGDTLHFLPVGDEIHVVKKSRDEILKAAEGIWKDAKDGYTFVRRLRAGWKKREARIYAHRS